MAELLQKLFVCYSFCLLPSCPTFIFIYYLSFINKRKTLIHLSPLRMHIGLTLPPQPLPSHHVAMLESVVTFGENL